MSSDSWKRSCPREKRSTVLELEGKEDVLICSGVQLRRNYGDLPFYGKLSDGQKAELNARAVTALADGDMSVEKLSADTPLTFEDMLASAAFSSAGDFAAEARIVTEDRPRVRVALGPDDQLSITVVTRGNALKAALEAANGAEELLSQGGSFAFDKNWGYLTAGVVHTGNAASAAYLLHLQGLGRLEKMSDITNELKEKNLEIRPLLTAEGLNAEFYCVVTRENLGKSTSQVFAEAEQAVSELVVRERAAREELIYDDMDRYADDVMRAMGLLLNARLMDYDELIDIYGDVRAGLTGGLLTGNLRELDNFVYGLSPFRMGEEFEGLSSRDEELIRADRVRRKFGESIVIKKI